MDILTAIMYTFTIMFALFYVRVWMQADQSPKEQTFFRYVNIGYTLFLSAVLIIGYAPLCFSTNYNILYSLCDSSMRNKVLLSPHFAFAAGILLFLTTLGDLGISRRDMLLYIKSKLSYVYTLVFSSSTENEQDPQN